MEGGDKAKGGAFSLCVPSFCPVWASVVVVLGDLAEGSTLHLLQVGGFRRLVRVYPSLTSGTGR